MKSTVHQMLLVSTTSTKLSAVVISTSLPKLLVSILWLL